MKTDYISVAEAARRWGVTPRQVQRLLAEKRIPGARRHGRAWMIPCTADKPADNRQNRRARAGESDRVYDMGCAMPLLSGVFEAGKCRAAIAALPDPARRLAEAELCLYTARADEAVRLCAELLDADDVCLRLSALLLTALASVACGDVKKTYASVRRISAYYDRVKDADLPDELRATVIFTLLTPTVLLHIDHPSTPEPEQYIRHLPEGLKLWGYYICAFILFLRGDYEEALGTAKAALNMSPRRYTIMDICLELLISMTLMELKRTAEAQSHFMAAWALARPDGLIFILGEHHSALQGLIESCLKKSYPEDYRAVIAVADAFNAGRKKLHAVPLSADDATLTSGGDLTATALEVGNDAALTADGDIILANLAAANSAALTAGRNVLDGREQGNANPNIKTKSAIITAKTGAIGASADKRIDVEIEDALTTDSALDTNLVARGDLTLIADTQTGALNVDGNGNLTIANTDKYNGGDLRLGAVSASGDVTVSAAGGFTLCDRLGRDAQVKGDNLTLSAANGSIGTAARPLRVDTNPGGVLNASAVNGTVNIVEVSDNMTVGAISATGSNSAVTLETVNGDIAESAKAQDDMLRKAVEAAQEAAKAQAKADALQDQFNVLENYVAALDKARDDIASSESAKTQAEADLNAAKAAEADAASGLAARRAELSALENSAAAPGDLAQKRAEVAAAEAALDAARRDIADKQQALNSAQSDLASALASARYDTFNKVPGLDSASDAASALDALAAEKAAKAAELAKLEPGLNAAKADAAARRAEADALASAAAPSGITSDGDITLQLNRADGKANVGTRDNALGVTPGGKLTVSGGVGTALENVFLEAGGDLVLNPIRANNRVDISAKGNITGANSVDRIIVAPTAGINSLSNVGASADNPLKISVDTVSASGVNVWLDNDKSLALDGVTAADEVGITADGDVTGDGDPTTDDVIGGNVDINATGNIGAPDDPLDIEAGTISATGENITIKSDGDMTVDTITGKDVTISSGGNIADTGSHPAVSADSLDISAAGAIGTEDNPFNVHVPGKLVIATGFGHNFLLNSFFAESATVVAIPAGIRVTGFISADAVLKVTREMLHADCPVCGYLAAVHPDLLIAQYKLELTGKWWGQLLVEIPVGAKYEGKVITLAYCVGGKLRVMHLTVENGYVSFYTDALYAYTLLDGVYEVATTPDGRQILVDSDANPIKTTATPAEAADSANTPASVEITDAPKADPNATANPDYPTRTLTARV